MPQGTSSSRTGLTAAAALLLAGVAAWPAPAAALLIYEGTVDLSGLGFGNILTACTR